VPAAVPPVAGAGADVAVVEVVVVAVVAALAAAPLPPLGGAVSAGVVLGTW
jgi:hypothetical protein